MRLTRRTASAATSLAAVSLLATAAIVTAQRSPAAHRPHPTAAPAADVQRAAPVFDVLPAAPKPQLPMPAAPPTLHRHVDIGVPHTDSANAPHFNTPGAAMRYLAAAWNARDVADLKHVTNPPARKQLDAMHAEATRLALNRCIRQPAGDYACYFTHEFPSAKVQRREDDGDGIGHAEFTVAPADRPGWYMTVFVGCGG